MEPVVALDYRFRPEARPRWVTWLGVVSIVWGMLGVLACVVRSRDAWTYVFDPTFRWNYPPLPWVCPAYLAAVLAGALAYVMLMAAGITSLIRPRAGLRFHLWCAAFVLSLAALTATLGAMQLLPHPDVSASSLAAGALIECALAGVYPVIIVFVVLRGSRSRGRPTAVQPDVAADR